MADSEGQSEQSQVPALARSKILFLRGLPWGVDEKDVKAFFSPIALREVTFVNCSNGRPTGEAFVSLDEKDTFDALLLHRQKLGKRYIEVHLSNEEGMGSRIQRMGVRDCSSGWLRIRGLPYQCSSLEVAKLFEDFQVTKDDVTMSVHSTGSLVGHCNGEAFVKLRNQETAAEARKALHMTWVYERYLEIYLMSEEERYAEEAFQVGHRNQLLQHAADCLIRMRGLPFSSTVHDVVEFLQGYNVEPEHVMLLQADGKPRGEALVWMDPDRVYRAKKTLHMAKMGRRYVELIPPGRRLVAWALESQGFPWVEAFHANCPAMTCPGLPGGAVPVPVWCDGNGQILMIGAPGAIMNPPCASETASSCYEDD
mmetsp:Transcript_78302/g.123243  ORF Transcript_78302/g.123243 Transcript_78302/m.123243 type:complete len:368 (+) Transcript_78302:41-1144(+)